MQDNIEDLPPNTFIYQYNRKGEPYKAIGRTCIHGQDMVVCDFFADDELENRIHHDVGQHMVDWFNGMFDQMRDRTVKRDRILNGERKRPTG